MLRLGLLTLDERSNALPLISAHALTAFPISFFPFKFGEILRLAAFFRVFNGRQKALAVWLAERFGDVLVITAFILGMYVFNMNVPSSMQRVLIFFLFISGVGLAGFFALTKISVYLNRHLVLTSLSARGLMLLKATHALRRLEADIYRSVEGRFSGFLLLSIIIWSFEIMALSLFINRIGMGDPDFSGLFVSGLLASLQGNVGDISLFGIYQSLVLVGLTILFIVVVWVAARFKLLRI